MQGRCFLYTNECNNSFTILISEDFGPGVSLRHVALCHTLMVTCTTTDGHMYHYWKCEGPFCQTPQTDQHVRLLWTVALPGFHSPIGAELWTGG